MNNCVGNFDFTSNEKNHFQDVENDEKEIRELWKSVVVASIRNGLSTSESKNSYSKTACCVADIIVEQFKQRFK